MGLGVCMCVHVYSVCIYSCIYVCACICQTCMHLCIPVCMCAQGQKPCLRTNQDSAGGVLAPWPLGGGASVVHDAGTCTVTVRLSCPEEGHMLLL